MKTVRLLFFIFAVGAFLGACATVDNPKMGRYDTPQHLWWDDLAFEKNVDGIPSDWSILDMDSDSFSNLDDNWGDIQSDAFDIMK